MLYRGGWPWPRPPRAPPRGSLSPLSFGRTDRRSEWLWLSLIRRPSVVRRNIPNSWPSGRFSISCFGICPKSSLYVTRGIKQDAALSRVSGRDAAGLSSRSQHVRASEGVVMLSPQSPQTSALFSTQNRLDRYSYFGHWLFSKQASERDNARHSTGSTRSRQCLLGTFSRPSRVS